MEVKGAIIGAISIVIITITLLALTPTIVASVATLLADADTWTFTGAAGAAAMLGLVPFVWVAGILLGAVVGMMVLARGKKD